MQRRQLLSQGGAVVGAVALSGCADQVEQIVGNATEEASDEAEGQVNQTLNEELVRPPSADVEVRDDGSVIVLSLGTDTVGVKCGLTEGEDPVRAVEESDQAATTAGTQIEECEGDFLIAVNTAGDIEVVAEL